VVVVTAAVPWPAMAAAVCAALAFGTSGALQHHVARRTDRGGRFGVVRSLARERVWLASLLVNVAGVVLQVVALSHAPVALVQPVLVLDLLFAVLGASVLRRHRPDRVVVGGALLCAGGLAVFLLLAAPTPGTTVPRPGEALLLGGGVVAIVGGCVVAARWGRGTRRALSLAAATGVLFGVTAGLAKVAANDLHRGVGEVVRDWPGYAALACAAAGFVLSQHAFRAGVAVAPSLAVMVVLNPLAGIGFGVLWLGERVSTGVGGAVALCLTVAGIAVLAKRAPAAAREDRGA
jgi:drug/metabolite transporter (DMT)-like permease